MPLSFMKTLAAFSEANDAFKVQLSLVSCLTIHKSRKLLAVAIAELYLETSAVCLPFHGTKILRSTIYKQARFAHDLSKMFQIFTAVHNHLILVRSEDSSF